MSDIDINIIMTPNGKFTLVGKLVTFFTVLQTGWKNFPNVEITLAKLFDCSLDEINFTLQYLEKEHGFKFNRKWLDTNVKSD